MNNSESYAHIIFRVVLPSGAKRSELERWVQQWLAGAVEDEAVLPLFEGDVEVLGVAMVSVDGAQLWRVVL